MVRIVTLEEMDEVLDHADSLMGSDYAAAIDLLNDVSLNIQPPPSSNEPFGQNYANWVMSTYRRLTAVDVYEPSTHEADRGVTDRLSLPQYFPFNTRDLSFIGRYLAGVGLILSELNLQPRSRVVEYGVGWGHVAASLARAGHQVTCVDIEPKFLELARRQAQSLGCSVATHHGEFGESPFAPDERRADAVVFFEAFHHAFDHLRVLRRLRQDVLRPGGMLILAAEPIHPAFPVPWGIRPDGHALWAVRRHKWMELGFQEDYLLRALLREGFVVSRTHVEQLGPFGLLYKCRLHDRCVRLTETLLPSDERASWAPTASAGESWLWAQAESRATLDGNPRWTAVSVTISNQLPVPLDVVIDAGGTSTQSRRCFPPGEQCELTMSLPPTGRELRIWSEMAVPSQFGVNDDQRSLGIAVHEVRYHEGEPPNSGELRCSIVICTDGRANALANTLDCLRYLDGPAFEVCVVHGPTEDGTAQLLSEWAGQIKIARNPVRNLSVSRNIGIAMARGEIVAFVDDDCLPEPEWLSQIIRAFDDPRVAGAGGIVMDHTGAKVQYRYSSADRLGNSNWKLDGPADDCCFPLSFNFPYLQGTNSAFRRDALLAIGGFDEEFEFYLDETDVCCRLIDRNWLIRQLPDAVVHHKFLSSATRTEDRVTRVLYPVLKNKLYFSLRNNHGHYSVQRAIDDMTAFVRSHEAQLRLHIEAQRISPSDLDTFWGDADRAWSVGLEKGLSGERLLLRPALLKQYDAGFLRFARPLPEGGRDVFVFISQEYPPDRIGGIGRHVHELARAVAMLGHHVHVLTRGADHDRIDFETGIWVHRLVTRPDLPPPPLRIPPHIWAHSATMLEALKNIASQRHVTAVHAPIWDCEGIAILLHGGFPLVTGLHTPLRSWLDTHPHYLTDANYQRTFAEPMLELERLLLHGSDAIHANSVAITQNIASSYGVSLDADRTAVIPHGVRDWAELPVAAPAPLPEGTVRLLFVGRLESRKGIDVLLEALPRLLARHARLHADIVGNDAIPGPEGIPYRAAFEATASNEWSKRVRFHGEVSEDRLRGFYSACDIFVAPSRFESFGLILLEAMMFGKPVVACRAGGMVEVAEEGRTALFADPGAPDSLEQCLERLISDPELRRTLGSAGRQRYEAFFTPAAMAERAVDLLRRASARRTVPAVAASA